MSPTAAPAAVIIIRLTLSASRPPPAHDVGLESGTADATTNVDLAEATEGSDERRRNVDDREAARALGLPVADLARVADGLHER